MDWTEIFLKAPGYNEAIGFIKNKKYDDILSVIYPKEEDMFKAFNYSSFNDIKVVILGQDPYGSQGQANGLAFSVNDYCKIPPSLNNIFEELSRDLNISKPDTGNLEAWAKQGVLLLNSVLTVEEGLPESHYGIGWEDFTNHILSLLSKRGKVVFMLWGKKAQEKLEYIDQTSNLILMTSHPSPFSVNQGFKGCSHFSSANNFLKEYGFEPINWKL